MTSHDRLITPDLPLPALPRQPEGTPWPTETWPLGEMPRQMNREGFDELVAKAFSQPDDLGETHAFLAVQGGKLIFEKYAEGFGPHDTYKSWSMAKSITQALIGILVREGKIDIHAPVKAPEWPEGDTRAAITLDQLLRMSSGLAFREDYEPDNPSDVIEMLWGSGKDDVAHFAASFPPEHAPDHFWSYSSGTSNIVARCAAEAAGKKGAEFEAFMRKELFDVIGMKNVMPKFDAAGTFIGSSFCYAEARDFAKFGLLYLRGGAWDGRQVLPEGWVDYARTPTAQTPKAFEEEGPYGAHWWLGMGGPGSFSANGFEGQFTLIVPDLDMVFVRHGRSPGEQSKNVKKWLGAVTEAFRQ
jgi:CubicO group peptidase (beta-lactamase class C family)